jgi:hypothetical protein
VVLEYQVPCLVYYENFDSKAEYEKKRNTLLWELKEINQGTTYLRIFLRRYIKPLVKK